MKILKSNDYISEKLGIEPITKDRLTNWKNGAFFIYQDKSRTTLVSTEALKSNKFDFVKMFHSISDARDFVSFDIKPRPTAIYYSAKMTEQLIEFQKQINVDIKNTEELINGGIVLFDPDTVNDAEIKLIDNTLDFNRWLLKH